MTVHVFDETTGRQAAPAEPIRFDKNRVTVREIIINRVRQEAQRPPDGAHSEFPALIEPAPVEQMLNAPQAQRSKPINADRQCEIALKAFKNRGFLLLVDDRHLESLDEEVELGRETQVTFLRLVPLVGG